MEIRYRMQSLRTGWGVEAPATREGKEQLKTLRKKHKDKFKWCRVYLLQQQHPEVTKVLTPFQLTNRKFG